MIFRMPYMRRTQIANANMCALLFFSKTSIYKQRPKKYFAFASFSPIVLDRSARFLTLSASGYTVWSISRGIWCCVCVCVCVHARNNNADHLWALSIWTTTNLNLNLYLHIKLIIIKIRSKRVVPMRSFLLSDRFCICNVRLHKTYV